MTVSNNWLGPAEGSHMVVAGGCGGIGVELVKQALLNRIEVIVLDLPTSITDERKLPGVTYIGFDAGGENSIKQAVQAVSKQWSRVDSFVFLCGYPILPRRNLSEVSLKQWNDLIAVNLTSAYLLSTALLPLLEQSSSASIVTVASSLGYQVMPGMGAYATSKAGLVGLTKALAMENAPRIRVNAVAPGAVDTEFLAGGTGHDAAATGRTWFDSMSDKYVASIPLGRVATPDDITGPIFFLAGKGSCYMTGQVLHLNGGRMTP